MSPLITVYILAYNRPDYLQDCLRSVVSQTMQIFRLVVLDNASKTDLKPIVDQAAYKLGRSIEYIRHPNNIESFGNFRYAWYDTKTTPFFVIFHDDDVMHPEFLARSLEHIQNPTKPSWAGCKSLAFTDVVPYFPKLFPNSTLYLSASELAYQLMTGRANVTFSTVIYRSDLTDKIDLDALMKSHSILFDRPLLFALAENNGCFLSSLSLVLYRCHPVQDSKNGPLNEDNLLELFISYKRILQPIWMPTVESNFFSWSGFQIPDSYKRLDCINRSSFIVYLQKARHLGVYRDFFLLQYLIGSIKVFASRIYHAKKKLYKFLFH